MENHVLYSGGANGADTFFGLIAKEYGIVEQFHYRAPNDNMFSQTLLDTGIKPTFLNEGEMNECYNAIDKFFKKKHKRNHSNDLKARNYFQALNSDGVYAIAKLNEHKIGVESGTNVAVLFAIQQQKPVYVYDYLLKKWFAYSFDNKKFVNYDDIPVLVQYFAGIGVRACQYIHNSNVPYLGIDVENDVKQQIRNLFEK